MCDYSGAASDGAFARTRSRADLVSAGWSGWSSARVLTCGVRGTLLRRANTSSAGALEPGRTTGGSGGGKGWLGGGGRDGGRLLGWEAPAGGGGRTEPGVAGLCSGSSEEWYRRTGIPRAVAACAAAARLAASAWCGSLSSSLAASRCASAKPAM